MCVCVVVVVGAMTVSKVATERMYRWALATQGYNINENMYKMETKEKERGRQTEASQKEDFDSLSLREAGGGGGGKFCFVFIDVSAICDNLKFQFAAHAKEGKTANER